MSGPLIFVHEGFPSHKGVYLAEKGALRLLSRGIYAENGVTRDAILGDGLRVLAYRYEDARLMGESARRVLHEGLSPVLSPHNRIYAARKNIQARRERELFPGLSVILRPEWPDNPFAMLSQRMITDLGHGGSAMWEAPSDAQILLDAALAPECAPSPEVCMKLLDGLPETHRDRLLSNPLFKEEALRWESASVHRGIVLPKQQKSIGVYLQELPVGAMAHDGISWRMDWRPGHRVPIADAQWENAIASLMPEGWQEETESAEAMRDAAHFLQKPRRLMNWTFRPGEREALRAAHAIANRIPDGGEMALHMKDGLFQGPSNIPWDGLSTIDQMFQQSDVPRISGFQPKVPGFIDARGQLTTSDAETPFTVLMKMDPSLFGNRKMEGIPVVEWACQSAGRHAGMRVAQSALVMDETALLLSERFDVPGGADTSTYTIAMDGAAAMGLHTSKKYNVSAIKLWKGLTATGLPQEEAGLFMDRFVAAWVMGDGDLHIKNVSMLLSSEWDGHQFSPWVGTLSPAYDMVCTRAFEFLKNDAMAFIVEGKQDRLTMKTWVGMGKALGIAETAVTQRVLGLATGIAEGLDAMARHPVLAEFSPRYGNVCRDLLEKAASVSRERAMDLGVTAKDIRSITPETIFAEPPSPPVEVEYAGCPDATLECDGSIPASCAIPSGTLLDEGAP